MPEKSEIKTTETPEREELGKKLYEALYVAFRLPRKWEGTPPERQEHYSTAAQSFLSSIHPEKRCVWKYDEWHDMYDTACNNGHCFISGSLKENSYKFCPYCSGKIQQPEEAKLK